jgi:predicted ester cyclase
MSTEENKAVIRRLAQVLNADNLDQLDDILAPNYIRHDPNPLLKDVGREEYKEAFAKLRGAFSDAKWTPEEILADGDKVILRASFHGTHEGQFFNIPPSGKEVTYPILAIYRIEDGMIVEDWHFFHSIVLWEQLIPEVRALIEHATR